MDPKTEALQRQATRSRARLLHGGDRVNWREIIFDSTALILFVWFLVNL